MPAYQVVNVCTALVCAATWAVLGVRARHPLSKFAALVWVAAMLFAASAGPIIAFTDFDPIVIAIGRVVTPVGWSALAISAAMRLREPWTL